MYTHPRPHPAFNDLNWEQTELQQKPWVTANCLQNSPTLPPSLTCLQCAPAFFCLGFFLSGIFFASFCTVNHWNGDSWECPGFSFMFKCSWKENLHKAWSLRGEIFIRGRLWFWGGNREILTSGKKIVCFTACVFFEGELSGFQCWLLYLLLCDIGQIN